MDKQKTRAVEQTLADIANRHGGILRPDDVVREAEPEDSVLHKLFDWRDSEAAHKWRLVQARVVIKSVQVVVHTDKTSVRVVGYVRDPNQERNVQGYVSTMALRADPDRAHAALADEFSRAAASLRRARELAQALGFDGELDAVIQSLTVTKANIQSQIEGDQAH